MLSSDSESSYHLVIKTKEIFIVPHLIILYYIKDYLEEMSVFFPKFLSYIISAPSVQFCCHIRNSGALRVAIVECRTLKNQTDLVPSGITFIQRLLHVGRMI